MSDSVQEQVFSVLSSQRGAKFRRTAEGERIVDHRCLFHDDLHQSASFFEGGTYFCRAEVQVRPLAEVAAKLGLRLAEPEPQPPLPVVRSASASELHGATPTAGSSNLDSAGSPPFPRLLAAAAAVYPYRHLSTGAVSHYKYRPSAGDAKCLQCGPGGEKQLPPAEQRAHLYAPLLQKDAVYFVVEGEKDVDAVNLARDRYLDHPIHALTAGGTAELAKYADEIAGALRELAPFAVIVFPDHDEPGRKAMRSVTQALTRADLPHKTYRWAQAPEKGDVSDYLAANGSLAALCAELLGDRPQAITDDFLSGVVVTSDRHFAFPGTRSLVAINEVNASAAYHTVTGERAEPRQTRHLIQDLTVTAMQNPHKVAFRTYSNGTGVYYRPAQQGLCYRVTPTGIELGPDPEGVFLAFSNADDIVPPGLDPRASEDALWELCELFNLGGFDPFKIDALLTVPWLGLQSPICLLKGDVGTGKTTLAKLLVAVVDPTCPDLPINRERWDRHEVIRTVQEHPSALLDDVSFLPSDAEDFLSRVSTGAPVGLRHHYQEVPDQIRVQRQFYITTNTLQIRSSALASRMVILEPEIVGGHLADRGMQEKLQQLAPRLRHRALSNVSRCLASQFTFNGTYPGRMADFAWVLTCLGYDANEILEHERQRRAGVIGDNDTTLETLVEILEAEKASGVAGVALSADEIALQLRQRGVRRNRDGQEWTADQIGRYLSEKSTFLADRGFPARPRKAAKGRRVWEFHFAVQEELVSDAAFSD